jgi:dGTPase
LIDFCDEIAYNTADLDDAYGAGLVRVEDARASVAKFAELWDIAEHHFPGAVERVWMKEVVRGLIDHLVSGLMTGTVAAAGGLTDVAAVRSAPQRLVRFTAETAQSSLELKRFLRRHVYESEALTRARRDSVELVEQLFEFFLRCPERMPAGYREEFSCEPLHRQVCDYIAGMTDGFLIKTCAQMGLR